MADTARPLDTIIALLPDNSSGSISPQDIRDTVVSMAAAHGEIYVSVAAATAAGITQTYYPVTTATTVLAADAMGFDMPANGRLRYTGVPDRVMHIACTVSVTCDQNNHELRMRLGKGGTSAAQCEVRMLRGTGASVESTALHWFIRMSTNDYIELFVADWTGTSNVTVLTCNLFAMGMIANA